MMRKKQPADNRPIEEILAELAAGVPAEEWRNVIPMTDDQLRDWVLELRRVMQRLQDRIGRVEMYLVAHQPDADPDCMGCNGRGSEHRRECPVGLYRLAVRAFKDIKMAIKDMEVKP